MAGNTTKFRDDGLVELDMAQLGVYEDPFGEDDADAGLTDDGSQLDDYQTKLQEDAYEEGTEPPLPLKDDAATVTPDVPKVEITTDAKEEPTPTEDPQPEEEEPAEAETPVPTEPPVDTKVPIARLNKEISKRQALEERLAMLEAAVQNQSSEQVEHRAVTIDASDFTKMNELMLEGKPEQAAEMFQAMMNAVAATAAENAIASSQQYVNSATQQAVRQSTEAELLQQTAWQVAEMYPILHNQSPDFDEAALQKVISLRDDLYQSGRFPAHVALDKAARLVMMDMDVSPVSQSVSQAPVQAVVEAQQAAPKAKPIDVQKKVELANSQPARLGGENGDGAPRVLDINNITDSEFDKLTIDELRRLRGDFI